ncbi:uncharacterized protein ANIA_11549 [Aspergillus nidulans FGSC A4]|uniref:Uncharacterized protein n=1 Tax=Emericella nidulans (strain FGSC A4 / ATCC 38163 / CBS 112.46 / NRRL 194 / M139) TaxID=227321 RepID=C8VD43_EMENI|nr:hypothetical protein [Aspergillus nidulans FGSC A4]CBF78917.1 TPA: hypothetical protein ANIA_11549 [Aspergillus nidulans FGSC A4]
MNAGKAARVFNNSFADAITVAAAYHLHRPSSGELAKSPPHPKHRFLCSIQITSVKYG